MSKDEVIILRVTDKQKVLLQKAAFNRGVTLTSFVIESAEKFATSQPASARTLAAVLSEVQKGGAMSYADVGRELRQLLISRPGFMALLNSRDQNGMAKWLDENIPETLTMIPTRKRQQLLKGIFWIGSSDRSSQRLARIQPRRDTDRQVKSR